MPTATLNGIDIYYELHGSGPRLLLLKGSGGTIAAAAPMIQKLAARFEVLIHDQRGLGRTTVPHGTPTMSDYAADDAALLDHLDWPSSLVFGTSFGGMVAQEFAALAPPTNSKAIASRIADSELRGYRGGHGFVGQVREALPEIISFLSAL